MKLNTKKNVNASKAKDVILEFYLEIWYCYEEGEGMNDALFTTVSYEKACWICQRNNYNIVKTIDMDEENEN